MLESDFARNVKLIVWRQMDANSNIWNNFIKPIIMEAVKMSTASSIRSFIRRYQSSVSDKVVGVLCKDLESQLLENSVTIGDFDYEFLPVNPIDFTIDSGVMSLRIVGQDDLEKSQELYRSLRADDIDDPKKAVAVFVMTYADAPSSQRIRSIAFEAFKACAVLQSQFTGGMLHNPATLPSEPDEPILVWLDDDGVLSEIDGFKEKAAAAQAWAKKRGADISRVLVTCASSSLWPKHPEPFFSLKKLGISSVSSLSAGIATANDDSIKSTSLLYEEITFRVREKISSR